MLVLDGKTFAGDQRVIARGVTATGATRIPGLVQTARANTRVLARVLGALGERGVPLAQPLLAGLAGAQGLRAAVRAVGGDLAVQRCQWPKRAPVVSDLATQDQPHWRRKREAASAHPTSGDATHARERRSPELRGRNASAAARRAEGVAETLPLHRLNVVVARGVSVRPTPLIERVMARLEATTRRVTRGRTSDQP